MPEYKKAFEDQLGEGALDKFDEAAKNNMANMNSYSMILYNNFKKFLLPSNFKDYKQVKKL